jgi:hypothetical protein
MRWFIGMAAVAVVAALTGCQSEDGYYDIPPDVAYYRVAQADITAFRKARQCGMLIYFSVEQEPRSALTWTVTSGDVRVAQFGVRFTAHGRGTIISIEVPKGPNGREMYDGAQTYTHPALMQPLRPAVREFIDAAIEQRPFDFHNLPHPLNTDQLCSEELQNFEMTGQPYRIDDPTEMTHAMAEDLRQQGRRLQVEQDDYFGVH